MANLIIETNDGVLGNGDDTITEIVDDDNGDNGNGDDNQSPTVAADQTVSFQENAQAGDEIGTIDASDSDGNIASLEITSSSGDIADYVNIASDGTVSLTEAGANDEAFNDFETDPNSFTATVEATDDDGATASEEVSFELTNDTADDDDGNGEFTEVDLTGQSEVTASAGVAEAFVFEFTSDSEAGVATSEDARVEIEGFDPAEDILRFDDSSEPAISEDEFEEFATVASNGFDNETNIAFLDPNPGNDTDAGQITLEGITDSSLGGDAAFFEVV